MSQQRPVDNFSKHLFFKHSQKLWSQQIPALVPAKISRLWRTGNAAGFAYVIATRQIMHPNRVQGRYRLDHGDGRGINLTTSSTNRAAVSSAERTSSGVGSTLVCGS
jgi:hypothetical protein